MSNEQNRSANDLDSLVGDGHLQMMKAALPYMNAPEQRFISLYVKFHELQRTIRLFDDEEVAVMGICSAGEPGKPASPTEMLETIKPYGTPPEQDFIDLVLNFFQGFRLASAAVGSSPEAAVPNAKSPDNPAPDDNSQDGQPKQPSRNSRPRSNPMAHLSFDQLKNFMPPEQQSRLETMQMMMSAMQQGI